MSKTISDYADEIMAEIDDMIAEGWTNSSGEPVPADLASFSQLHEYCDANDLLIEAKVPFGSDLPEGTDPCEMVNAVTDEVTRRLAARAADLQHNKTA
jgi:hypothetical protein